MYPKEQKLIQYYNDHPEYASVNANDLVKAFDYLGLDFKKIKTCLDLGCGDGRFSIGISRTYNVGCVGIDYSLVRVNKAYINSMYLPCRFECRDIHMFLEECTRTYDIVVLLEVLEHLEAPRLVVEQSEHLSPVTFASVPINMPWESHLHVYKDIGDVLRDLRPDKYKVLNKHAYLLWRNQ